MGNISELISNEAIRVDNDIRIFLKKHKLKLIEKNKIGESLYRCPICKVGVLKVFKCVNGVYKGMYQYCNCTNAHMFFVPNKVCKPYCNVFIL